MSPSSDFNHARLGPAPGARMVVLGGCGGIGRALVQAAVDTGIRVAVWDLYASLSRHPPPAGVANHGFDASVEAGYAQALELLPADWNGAVDAFVALAGFAADNAPLGDTGADTWDEVIAGNLRSTFLANRALLPRLKASGAGAIVNMSSGLALRTTPGYGPYSAAKAGVIALTKTLAAEAAPLVRANAVAPSAVDTAFLRGGTGRVEEDGRPPRLEIDAYARAVPLQRIACADDVVGPILFLAGPASRYMTGQVLHISAGMVTP